MIWTQWFLLRSAFTHEDPKGYGSQPRYMVMQLYLEEVSIATQIKAVKIKAWSIMFLFLAWWFLEGYS